VVKFYLSYAKAIYVMLKMSFTELDVGCTVDRCFGGWTGALL